MAEFGALAAKVGGYIGTLVDNLVTVEVTTVVSPLALADDTAIADVKGKFMIAKGDSITGAVTRVNMATADVTNVIAPTLADAGDPVMVLHNAMVTQSQAMFRQNVETLVELFKTLQAEAGAHKPGATIKT